MVSAKSCAETPVKLHEFRVKQENLSLSLSDPASNSSPPVVHSATHNSLHFLSTLSADIALVELFVIIFWAQNGSSMSLWVFCHINARSIYFRMMKPDSGAPEDVV